MRKYKVKKGDTLSKIALSQLHDSSVWPELAEENNLSYPFTIFEGMQLDVPATDLDQRNQCSVHAPIHFLQDHASVHAPLHNIDAHHSHHASFRPTSLTSTLSKSNEARSVHLPNLKIPFEVTIRQVLLQPSADITTTVKGELNLKKKGSIVDIGLMIGKNPSDPFGVSFKSENYLDVEGNLIGKDDASIKIKSAYHSKLVELVGSPQIEFDYPTSTGSLRCGLTVAAKVKDKEVLSAGIGPLDPARPNEIHFAVETKQTIDSEEYEISGKVGFDVTVSFRGKIESIKRTLVKINIPMPRMILEPPSKTPLVIVFAPEFFEALQAACMWLLVALL